MSIRAVSRRYHKICQSVHDFIDSLQHFATDRFPDVIGTRLDAQQFYIAAQLQSQIGSQDVERHGVRGGAQAVQFFHIDPANGTGLFVHFCRIDEKNDIGREAAKVRGPVFGSVTRIQDEEGIEASSGGGLCQTPRDQDPRRVIRAERIADPNDRDPGRPISPKSPVFQ